MKNKTLFRILHFILFMVIFVACWDLFDLLYSKVITQNDNSFTVKTGILTPLCFGVLIYLVMFIFATQNGKKNAKDNENNEK